MVQSGLSFVGFDGIGGNSHMLANSFFTFDKWLPFAIFGLFAAVAWWLMDMLGGQSNRATERLDELRNPGARRRDEAGKGRG
jgi:hypothetical protein